MHYEIETIDVLKRVRFTLNQYDEEENTISGEITFEDADDIFLLLQADGHIPEIVEYKDELSEFESVTMEIVRTGNIYVDYQSQTVDFEGVISEALFTALERILELMDNPSTITINFYDLKGWEY